jgi:hypothetical protein
MVMGFPTDANGTVIKDYTEDQSGAFTALRSLRALRPLRTLSRVPGLQMLVTTIVTSVPKLGQV